MIVGVGIDVVGVSRFAQALDRTPALVERAFTPRERVTPGGRPRSTESLAARFAAKEALAKALGAPGNLRWHDAEIAVVEHGRPVLEVRGTVAGRAEELGVTGWHLSMSHDAGIASAVVIAESLTGGPQFGGTAGAPQFGGTAGGPQFGGTAGGPQFGGTAGGPQFRGTAGGPQFGGTAGGPESRGRAGAPQFGGTAGGLESRGTAGGPG